MPLIKRHISNSISYRIIGTATTIVLTVFAGLPIKWAGIVGKIGRASSSERVCQHERISDKFIKLEQKK